MHYMAKCCQPIPGDDIAGYITIGRGISIHRSDCDQFIELQTANPERVVDACWGENCTHGFKVSIQIIANDRHGLLRDITTVLANDKIGVLGVDSYTDHKNQLANINIKIELNNIQVLSKVLARLAKIDDVINAKRL